MDKDIKQEIIGELMEMNLDQIKEEITNIEKILEERGDINE